MEKSIDRLSIINSSGLDDLVILERYYHIKERESNDEEQREYRFLRTSSLNRIKSLTEVDQSKEVNA
jgi:hypothetical protein